jgi:hypothetical protein
VSKTSDDFKDPRIGGVGMMNGFDLSTGLSHSIWFPGGKLVFFLFVLITSSRWLLLPIYDGPLASFGQMSKCGVQTDYAAVVFRI